MSASSAANLPHESRVQGQEEQKPVEKKVVHRQADEVKTDLEPLPSKTTPKLGLAAVILSLAQKVRHFVSDGVGTDNKAETGTKLKDGSGTSGVNIKSGRKIQGAAAKLTAQAMQQRGPAIGAHRAAPGEPPRGQPMTSATLSQMKPKAPATSSPRAATSSTMPSQAQPKASATPSPRAATSSTTPSQAQPKASATPSPRAATSSTTPSQAQPKAPSTATPQPAVPQAKGQPTPTAIPQQKARPHSLPAELHKEDLREIAPELAKAVAHLPSGKSEETAPVRPHSIAVMPKATPLTMLVNETVVTEESFLKQIQEQRAFYSQVVKDPKLSTMDKVFVKDLLQLYERTDRELTAFLGELRKVEAQILQTNISESDKQDALNMARIRFYSQNVDRLLTLHKEGIELQNLFAKSPSLLNVLKRYTQFTLNPQAFSPIQFTQRPVRYVMLMKEVQKQIAGLPQNLKFAENVEKQAESAARVANEADRKVENEVNKLSKKDIQTKYDTLTKMAAGANPNLKAAYQEFRAIMIYFPLKVENDQRRLEILKAAEKGQTASPEIQAKAQMNLNKLEGDLNNPHLTAEGRKALEREQRLFNTIVGKKPDLSKDEQLEVKKERENLEKEPKVFPISRTDMEKVFKQIDTRLAA